MSRGRKIALGVAAALAVALALGVTQWYLPMRELVGIGNGMLAKQMCSCIFVARREVDACRADQFSSMDAIEVVVEREARRVRAFVPAFGERSAVYRDGLGCSFEVD